VIERVRTEWQLLTSWPVEDWMWASLLFGWIACAGMALADTPTPTTSVTVPWPQIEWRITLGNVGTIFAVAWWVGRWGARQVALLDHLPQAINDLTRRMDAIEHEGCGQLREHRRLLALLKQHGIDPGITLDTHDTQGKP